MSPVRAILPHSPGRKPWVNRHPTHSLSPDEGRHSQRQILTPKVPLLVGALFSFVCAYPGFHIGLCLHFTLGFAGVPCPKALVISLNFDALVLTSKVRCIHRNKYDVLTNVSTRTYTSKYTYLLSRVRCTYSREYTHLLSKPITSE